MLAQIIDYTLIATLYAIPVAAGAALLLAGVLSLHRLLRRTFAPHFEADFSRAVTSETFASEHPMVRRRRALRNLRAAATHLRAARGSLKLAQPLWRSGSLSELRAKLGTGYEARQALLVSAGSDLLAALVLIESARARCADLQVGAEGLDLDLVDPLDHVRRRTRAGFLALQVMPGLLTRAVERWISNGLVGRALRSATRALGSAELAYLQLEQEIGPDSAVRAKAFATPTPAVRRRQAEDDLISARRRLLAAEGDLQAASSIGWRLFLGNQGRDRHDALLLEAAEEMVFARHELQVARARRPDLKVDDAALDCDLSDPLASNVFLRLLTAVTPGFLKGAMYWALAHRRLYAALDAVRAMRREIETGRLQLQAS